MIMTKLNPLIFFFLTVLFYLLAWAGSNAFVRLPENAPAVAVWNKFFAILCLIAGIIAVILFFISLG